MKTMASWIIGKNKIAFIACATLLSFMLVNNRLFQYLVVFMLIFMAYYQMVKFIPYRFSKEDALANDNYLNLLPIQRNVMQKANFANALIWSFSIFIATLWLYTFVFNGLSGQVVILSGLAAFFIPISLSIYEYYRHFLPIETWYCSLFVCCIGVFAIGLSNSELSKITTLGVVGRIGVIIILTLSLVWVRDKYWENINGYDYGHSKNRMFRIYRTSRYYFSKLNGVPEVLYVYVVYFCVKGEMVIVGIYALLVSLFLIYVNVESFFSHVSLIDLLPIRTNEKKLTCTIMSLLSLMCCNGFMALVLVMFNWEQSREIISFYLALVSLSVLAYSLYVTYYHRGKNWALLCSLPLVYVIIAFVTYHYFTVMGNMVFIPLMLVSCALLVIDYQHGSDVATLI